jgi:RHS repeat-associated protein
MDGHTPSALTAGSPVGSFPLSDFESVNPYSGGLNVHFPLVRIGGRGSAGYTMMLPIERRWNVEHTFWPPPNPSCTQCPWGSEQNVPVDFYMPLLVPAIGGYGPGKLQLRVSGEGYTDCPPSAEVYYQTTLTRLTFTAADGTQIEFRDSATGGQPRPNPMASQCTTGQGFNRGKVFFAGDGSAAIFISDTDIKDFVLAGDYSGSPATGNLLLADGSIYRVENGEILWMRDRNGNKVTATTDSLGRQVTVTPAIYPNVPYDQISYQGFGGASRSIKVWYGTLHELLRVTQPTDSATIKTYQQLFPGLTLPNLANYDHDPGLVSRLELPDGRNYRFFYNVYGELARVEFPTGGAIEYDYDGGLAAGTSGLVNGANPGIYRRVIERRVYTDATNLSSVESKTTFSKPQIRSVTDYDDFVDVTALDAAGNVLSRVRHFYHSNAGLSFFSPHFPNEYTDWHEGREYKAEFYSLNNSLLKRVENLWDQTPSSGAENNPHITRTTTTLTDVTPNLVTKQEFTYDQYNNQTDVYEYDFGSGAPGPLRRRTHTDYVTATAYTDVLTGAHLRRLPLQTLVYDAAGVVRAQSGFEYDNYTNGPPNHAALISRTSISGFDSAFSTSYTTRGNVTASIVYLLSNGAVTGSFTAYNQYDIAGNLVRAIDARGYSTDFDFSDRFGAPNGEAQSNIQPAELGSTSSYAFVTKATNALGHRAYTQFDYYLGRPVDTEDANGIVTSAYFNDVFDRPTQVRRAVGTALMNQTTFAYDDVARIVTTTSDVDANNVLVSKTLYDGLGRTTETRTYEGGTNYIAVKQIPFAVLQDPDTGAWIRSTQSSNPYRPYLGEQPVWTTSFFDALDRVVKLRTPDNAIIRTSYSGNTVTVTDQDQPAGKKRKSVADALGRMIEVDEDPAGLNYQTFYGYDVLNNLTTVNQGTQTRSFVYDSLKRLISGSNPENGTITYQYDGNGNLLVKTDARNVSTHFDYDALNRPVRRWYNGSNTLAATTQNSPALPANVSLTDEAKFYYDSQSLPAGAPSYLRGVATGRLVAQTYGSGSNGDYYAYDVLGRPTLKIQQNGAVNYQMSAAYNLSGAVTTLTYPSGHTINNTYDQVGRLATFSGNLGDGGTPRTYATGIIYSPFGGLVKEQFGTTTPIYNKLFYNSRGQLAEIRVSTSYTGPTDINWNRGAIINNYSNQCWGMCSGLSMTDNNGNLKKQEVYIPNDDQISGYTMRWQQYDYDSLNRLNWAREVLNGTEQWKQQFTYDRWGNRTINTGVTYGIGINNKAFTVDTSNNRLGVPAGQSGVMSYDAAGNLTNDTYTGAGTRTYDAENRITSAWGGNNQAQLYGYDANGQRIKRTVDGVETWQVYGFEGELLAEYPANGPAASSKKEYGYRNGQLLVTVDAPAPSPSGYAYRRAITIDHTKVPNTDQSNFPVLISGTYSYLATVANGGNVQNANGYDVIVTSDTTCATKLSHEVETYNGATGAVNYWVKVPLLSHTTDTTIYLCYGNSSVTTDQSNKTAVWDANYKGVWHLSNGTTLNASDSTTNGNNGTISGAVATAGRSDGGASLNGTSDHVQVKAGKVDTSATSGTVSAWVKMSALDENGVVLGYGGAAATDPALWGVYIREVSGNYYFAIASRKTNGGTYSTVRGSTVLASGTWYYVTYSSNGSSWKIRVNGPTAETLTNVLGTNTGDWLGDIAPTIPDKSDIGGVYAGGAYSSVNFWHGILDEVRLSNVERSDDWVSTEYNNQNSPATFYTVSSATNLTVTSQANWLVTDQLGTPRMIIDQTGSLANVRRHDYLPFGEELFGGTNANPGSGGRKPSQGYGCDPSDLNCLPDGTRQQFTLKERDFETGLDYFGARYYASRQGRFTSVDPGNYQAMSNPTDPQSWNGYSYVNSNPLTRIDRDGKGFFTKLKNFLLWHVWGEEADVQREENKRRQMLLDLQSHSSDGVLRVENYGGQYIILHPEQMDRLHVFVWSDRVMEIWEAGGGQRQLTPQEMANVIDSAGMLPTKPVNLPSSSKITVDMDHIESGHMEGGSRLTQSRAAGGSKDVFPSQMNKNQVESAIRDAYQKSSKLQTQGERVLVQGQSGKLTIQMWVNTTTKIIESAWPVY